MAEDLSPAPLYVYGGKEFNSVVIPYKFGGRAEDINLPFTAPSGKAPAPLFHMSLRYRVRGLCFDKTKSPLSKGALLDSSS